MKKNLMFFTIALLVIMTSLFAGCGKEENNPSNSSGNNKKESISTKPGSSKDDKELFTIRVVTQTGFNETNIADELGYFKEEGIKIKYTGVLKPGITEYQLIAQDINDAFIGGHPPNVAQARLAGIKVLAVAPGMIDNEKFPHVRYLVKEDSPIKTLSDINGKKVSITSVSACTDGYLKYYLKKNNLPDKVEWVKLPNPGQQEQSVIQGLVDMATSHPPYAGIALKKGGLRQIATSWDILHKPEAGLSVRGFSEDFIKEHPDVVRGFCAAMAKARVWINSHHEEAKQIIAKVLKLESGDLSVFWYDEHKAIEQPYIETWFDIAEDIGLWKKGEISPTDTYTNEYAPK
jgi:ABC-type nitrate/sulfonate/bicarbonate transport system substrate-binding protein